MALASKARATHRFSRSLAEIVNRALDPLILKQGFGETSLLLQWETIIGARVAGLCEPIRLQWPPRAKKASPDKAQEPATLILRVEPGFGLDIQHMSGAIIDRVNTHLGWRCVSRLSIRQEALHRHAPKTSRKPPQDPRARAQAEAAAAGVDDQALHAALVSLGERVMAGKGKA